MEILKKERKMCLCCMQEHEVALVRYWDKTLFKEQEVEYEVICEYCELADEYFESDEMISTNTLAMKNAYRKKMNLLTTENICDIRKKYHISQAHLASLLGWGEKTITRYEGHQVQDVAHDTILRKINEDPEWFVSLLDMERGKFSVDVYTKYRDTALNLYETYQDSYLRKSIEAQYAKFNGNLECCGGMKLNLDKVIEVMRYLANSDNVDNLYKVKMMKLLWFVDALSYKRRDVSVTGLAYTALPMGAVPVAHKSIIELRGVVYKEVDFGDAVGYKFIKVSDVEYDHLTEEDRRIIDDVICICGKDTREQIVQRMHKEKAYTNTNQGDIISYQYTKELTMGV